MNLSAKIIGGCIVMSFVFSCKIMAQESNKNAVNYPNKDSELALLMREVVSNTEQVKQQIIEGKPIEFFIAFEKLHTAIPTESDLREDGKYASFADSYIFAVKELIKSSENKKELYNSMVQTCINCHQQICPGPVSRIKKLKIKP